MAIKNNITCSPANFNTSPVAFNIKLTIDAIIPGNAVADFLANSYNQIC